MFTGAPDNKGNVETKSDEKWKTVIDTIYGGSVSLAIRMHEEVLENATDIKRIELMKKNIHELKALKRKINLITK